MTIGLTMALGLALAAGAPALAQTATAQSAPAKNNVAIKDAHTVNDGGARSGANSFTQQQAREHIAKSGFTAVSALAKDKQGIWRGTAHQGDRTVKVALDFKGNVSTGK